MKAWLAEMMLGALHMVWRKLFDYLTDPVRAQKKRYAMRVRWNHYLFTARNTKVWWRIRVAEFIGIVFKFEALPIEAVDRGDTNPDNAKPGRPELYRIH